MALVLALLLPLLGAGASGAAPAGAVPVPAGVARACAGALDGGLAVTRAATGTTLLHGTVHAGVSPAGTLVAAYEDGDGFIPTAVALVVGTSATSGTFELPWVPAGTYRLVHLPPHGTNLAAHWSGGSSSRTHATPIVVGGNVQAVPDETLRPTATISGRVTGPGGVGQGGIVVAAFPPGTAWLPVSQAVTRPDGTYSLDRLAAGDYQLYVVPPSHSGLARTWAPGTHQRSAATVITVNPGDWVAGIDAPVTTSP